MPTPRQQLVQIQAWSYSRFQNYETCPAKAKFLYVNKLKEPDSKAGAKGTRVHAIAALIATGKLPPVSRDTEQFMPELKLILKSKQFPTELETFKQEFKDLKGVKVMTESEWAFTQQWEPTGWFDPDCWLRIKVDLHWLEITGKKSKTETHVKIRDHKTGKIHEDHKLQRSLYALGAFLVYPDALTVEAAHWYLDQGVEKKETWDASQLDALKKEWLLRTTAMLNDTTYAPRPGDYCRYCHFRKENGGPCKF